MKEFVPSSKLIQHRNEKANAVDARGVLPENDPSPCLRRNGMPETLVRPSTPRLQIRTDCSGQRPPLASRPTNGFTFRYIRQQPVLPNLPRQTSQSQLDPQRAPGQRIPPSTLNPRPAPKNMSYGYMTQYYKYPDAAMSSKQPPATLQPSLSHPIAPRPTEASWHSSQKITDPDFDTPILPSRRIERKKQQRPSGLAQEWNADRENDDQDSRKLSRAEKIVQAIAKRDRVCEWLKGIIEDEQTAENACSTLLLVQQRFLGTEKLVAQKYRGDGEGMLRTESKI